MPTHKITPRKGRTKVSVKGSRDPLEHVTAGFEQYAAQRMPGVDIGKVTELMRSTIRTTAGILYQNSVAWRHERHYQRMMKLDPDVYGPLRRRQLATALLEWSIDPEDDNDPEQVRQAAILESAWRRNMRRSNAFLRALMEAIWYGPAACNVDIQQKPFYVVGDDGEVSTGTVWAPARFIPIHSDSLHFNDKGELHFSVNTLWEGPKVQGPYGPVRPLTDLERQAVILHVHDPEGVDYEDIHDARTMFAGRGLRDVVFFTWMLKQRALQVWATFIERYALGIREFTYPKGDQGAEAAVKQIAENMMADNFVLLPIENHETPEMKFTLHQADPGPPNAFAGLIEGYLGGQIKEAIEGQSAMTEQTTAGLGDGVSTRHAETFRNLVRYDAQNLEDTINHELVRPLSRFNFGETPWQPTFSMALEDVDSEKWMDGVSQFVQLGGVVGEDEVRDKLGISRPKDGQETLGLGNMFGGEDVGGLGFGEPVAEDEA